MDEDEEGEKKKKKKSKMKATKDNKLLSFGDEAEDDEAEIDNIKKVEDKKSGKSAHDLLDDPKLSRDVGEEFQGLEESDQKGDTTGEDQLISIREKLKKPKSQFKSDHVPPQRKPEKDGYRSGHLQNPVVFAFGGYFKDERSLGGRGVSKMQSV